MTKVVIGGAAGRMGHALIRCAGAMDGICIVGAVEREDHPDLGKDAGTIAGVDALGVDLSADMREALTQADVLIDFTLHSSVPITAELATELGRAVVIGTTGLTEEETMTVDRCADRIPIVWAPNMSVGMNLLFAMVKDAASALGAGYSVEIDETHHVHKLDAPSGTALQLGEKVADGAGEAFTYLHDEEGAKGTTDPSRIVIRSYRKGEAIGDHTVSFSAECETIEFSHHARSRDAFAMGALRAAQWVCARKPRIYDMQDVLNLR